MFVETRLGPFFALPRMCHAIRVKSLFKTANPLKARSSWVSTVLAVFWALWTLNIISVLFLVVEEKYSTDLSGGSRNPDNFSMLHIDTYLEGYYWAAITISSVRESQRQLCGAQQLHQKKKGGMCKDLTHKKRKMNIF
eukprot:TRINITY_DN1318_c0_g1_i7.p1 TRINITY_DN1318_c0_g1~~TRINITY_DN1318_c0_g1_i7.p1  ORF type:complete len:138 (-),score=8.10 TRINITY_DN1318_c0_g1_i7:48-461(-)